jgi:hypothetical protein
MADELAAMGKAMSRDSKRIEQLQSENERLRAIIDKLTAKAPATASLAVFLCSQCGEAKDTVYDLDTGQVCANCIQSS